MGDTSSPKFGPPVGDTNTPGFGAPASKEAVSPEPEREDSGVDLIAAGVMQRQPSVLRLTRKKQWWNFLVSDFPVTIDIDGSSIPAGVALSGKTIEIPITTGQHTVEFHMEYGTYTCSYKQKLKVLQSECSMTFQVPRGGQTIAIVESEALEFLA